jgi:hypothetical protein
MEYQRFAKRAAVSPCTSLNFDAGVDFLHYPAPAHTNHNEKLFCEHAASCQRLTNLKVELERDVFLKEVVVVAGASQLLQVVEVVWKRHPKIDVYNN